MWTVNKNIFLAFAALLLCVFSPSHQLTQIHFANPLDVASLEIPDFLFAGEPLVVHHLDRFKTVNIGGLELTKVPAKDLAFGVAAFEAKSTVVHGILSQRLASIWKAQGHNQEVIFQKDLLVKYDDQKNPPVLRIPASVWQTMDDSVKELKRQQREKMMEVLSEAPSPLNLSCWQRPLKSKHVSEYAAARTLPDGTTYHHSGLDLRAATGTPIRAMGEGSVKLAEGMILPGNVVVIDHGGGVYSRYLHLSKILVTPGQQIAKNDLVGDAGATGRVEASHLHWEVVWKTNPANPERFLKLWEQLCDPG